MSYSSVETAGPTANVSSISGPVVAFIPRHAGILRVPRTGGRWKACPKVGVHAPRRIDSGVRRRDYGMDASKPRARRIDEATATTLVAAFEAYSATGECPIMCDRCRTPI